MASRIESYNLEEFRKGNGPKAIKGWLEMTSQFISNTSKWVKDYIFLLGIFSSWLKNLLDGVPIMAGVVADAHQAVSTHCFFFFDGCLWGLLNHCNSKKKNQPQTTTLGIRISVSCLLFLCLIYHAVHCSRVNFVTFNFRFRVPRSRIIYKDCTDLICIGYEIKRRTGRKNSIKSGRCLSGYVD